MPKLWSETIVEHRSAVWDAILDATADLVHRDGIAGLTMTSLARASGIGRATLYRYVPDIATAIRGWHEREIARHLEQLHAIADRAEPDDRLGEVLRGYARLMRHRHGGGHVHGDHLHNGARHESELFSPAHDELRTMVTGLIQGDAAAGRARTDLSPADLAAYAVAAIGSAALVDSPRSATQICDVVIETLTAAPR